jgi:hypothetical protein
VNSWQSNYVFVGILHWDNILSLCLDILKIVEMTSDDPRFEKTVGTVLSSWNIAARIFFYWPDIKISKYLHKWEKDYSKSSSYALGA